MSLFNSYKSNSDEELVELFQRGKSAALEELYHRYGKRLLHFMYRMLNHDESRAQDLLHDVFLKLAEQPRCFDTTRSFKPWVFAVAANACRKEFRQPGQEEIGEHLMPPPRQFDQVMAQLDGVTFRRALKRELTLLHYEHRCTFIMRFQEQFSIREISEMMDCPEGTVKSRIHYTIKHLAEKLEAFNPVNTQ